MGTQKLKQNENVTRYHINIAKGLGIRNAMTYQEQNVRMCLTKTAKRYGLKHAKIVKTFQERSAQTSMKRYQNRLQSKFLFETVIITMLDKLPRLMFLMQILLKVLVQRRLTKWKEFSFKMMIISILKMTLIMT